MEFQRLFRVWYDTDAGDQAGPDPTVGTVSDSFPAEKDGRRIIAVDWSTPGEVEVTWLIPGTR